MPHTGRDFFRSLNANTWEIPYSSQCTAAGAYSNCVPKLKPLLPKMARARNIRHHQAARCGLIVTEPRKFVAPQHIFANVCDKTHEASR
jgi:hypothetical protein